MKKIFSLLLFILASSFHIAYSQTSLQADIQRWKQQAQRVEIIRDSWGIPHIYGKTDADVVFGLLYTQCEDDFQRVEANYIDAIGRMAEVRGEAYLWHDLRARMFLDSTQAKAIYQKSPQWLKKLCDAFADGINYYLYKNPEVKPQLITRFQPWMPIMFSEGSIGGNITVVSTRKIQQFYENTDVGKIEEEDPLEEKLAGSNGFAIAPSNSASGNALLLINPHTSFYFRSEVHMISEEGLNAYGAVTWGQFFIYQGFNENCGWMHTSSRADTMDEFMENITEKNGRWYYQYGTEIREVELEEVELPYLLDGKMKKKKFTIYKTHHGPVTSLRNGRWTTTSMMNRPMEALIQSYNRTKANGYKQYNKLMKWNANSSNNTVFADSKGNIAYWHGNFMPKRNPELDFSGPMDGKNPMTDWQGYHKPKEIVQLLNPESGWLQNCNSTPFTAAGEHSPNKEDYPTYMAPDRENFRGINAVRVLQRENKFDLNQLIDAAFDPYLSAFAKITPALIAAFEKEKQNFSSPKISAAINLMKDWDMMYDTASIPTAIAIFWAEDLLGKVRNRFSQEDYDAGFMMDDLMIKHSSEREMLESLQVGLDELEEDFGTWKTPWGEINRFQRLTGKIRENYDDDQPSIPVGFTSSRWGSLAAFWARTYDTKRRYGSGGNSFIAVVEFGDRLKARSIVSGGQSNDPASPHFDDQASMFCNGAFKTVNFYREDVEKNAERIYRPGE